MSQQCILATQKANCMFSCIRSAASRLREVLVSLLLSPHLEHHVQLWGLQHNNHTESL